MTRLYPALLQQGVRNERTHDADEVSFSLAPQTRQLSTRWATFKDSKIVVVFGSCCGEDFSMICGTAVGHK